MNKQNIIDLLEEAVCNLSNGAIVDINEFSTKQLLNKIIRITGKISKKDFYIIKNIIRKEKSKQKKLVNSFNEAFEKFKKKFPPREIEMYSDIHNLPSCRCFFSQKYLKQITIK